MPPDLTPDQFRRIERIYDDALELPAGKRQAFIIEAAGADDATRRKIEALLRSREELGRFLERPALEVAAQLPADDSTHSLAGRTISHYRIDSVLGRGGMGVVYLAYDTQLERQVALKVLPPEAASDPNRQKRFIREGKAAAAINHPNAVHIYEVGDNDGIIFIAMEYVEGQTLANRISSGPMKTVDAVRIAIQVAAALEAAHAKGITHRDIKPANLMLAAGDQVKVTDFGLAKVDAPKLPLESHSRSRDSATSPGMVMGTEHYMSPEQISGQEVEGRSDLFSVGVVLYEMASGRRPFEGPTFTDTTYQILHAQPPAIMPARLGSIVRNALEKDPARRYQTAAALLQDLKSLERSLTSSAGEIPLQPEISKPHASNYASTSAQRHTIAALLVGALLVVGAGVWISGWRLGGAPVLKQLQEPAAFRVEDNRLVVMDSTGNVLWQYTLPFALGSTYETTDEYPQRDFVQFGDLDGDGKNEVIFIAKTIRPEEQELFVFSSGGTVLFRRRPGRATGFDDGKTQSPPFFPMIALLTAGGSGKKNLWLMAQHNKDFAAVVEKLSPDGQVVGEYWSNGHITRLAEATWNNRSVILVGALYNHKDRASLAVLDYENPSGSAPSMDPSFRCTDCPAGEPLLFYVFPRMEIARLLNQRPRIDTLRVTPHGETQVGIESAGRQLPGDQVASFGSVFYTFDSNLELKDAEISDSYRELHGRLQLSGKLHEYGASDEAELFPVLRWDGSKLVEARPP